LEDQESKEFSGGQKYQYLRVSGLAIFADIMKFPAIFRNQLLLILLVFLNSFIPHARLSGKPARISKLFQRRSLKNTLYIPGNTVKI
jgi:hypothetical protein